MQRCGPGASTSDCHCLASIDWYPDHLTHKHRNCSNHSPHRSVYFAHVDTDAHIWGDVNTVLDERAHRVARRSGIGHGYSDARRRRRHAPYPL